MKICELTTGCLKEEGHAALCTRPRSPEGETQRYSQDAADPRCPQCGISMERVEQSSPRMLNADQYDAIKPGNWFCRHCPGDRGKSGYLYLWDREVILRDRRHKDRRIRSTEASTDELRGRLARAIHSRCLRWTRDGPPCESCYKDADRYIEWVRAAPPSTPDGPFTAIFGGELFVFPCGCHYDIPGDGWDPCPAHPDGNYPIGHSTGESDV